MVSTLARAVDNLPAEITRVVGRRAEAAAVKRLLSESRLVTLTGTGGVGKTRLAVHAARQVRAAFPAGVCLVTLADLNQSELLAPTVLTAVGQVVGASAGVVEVADQIGDRQLLLILDNCEHLAQECAALATDLLRRCPKLRVLATSQERLRIDGEAVYAVPPLAFPEEGTFVRPGEVTRYDAVRLFVERATALNPDLSLSASDEEAVVTLCRALDGLPLAIELVAGRTGALPITALVDRQHDQLGLLTAGSRSAPPRHQTLRATVNHSHDLCSKPARLLWARMSVFAGGSTFDSILSVCADEELIPADVVQALAELVDKSIVRFDGSRYRLLDTIREYGRERLQEFAQEPAARSAHLEYFAKLAEQAASSWPGRDQLLTLGLLRTELANLRAALQFCLADPGQSDTGLRMASSLWAFWLGCGLQREGRHWLDELLVVGTASLPSRVNALWVNAYLAVMDGDLATALELSDQCADLARGCEDLAGVAHATYVRGVAELFLDQVETAVEHLETAVRLERGLPGTNPLLVSALLSLGISSCYQMRLDRASEVLTEARQISEAAGDQLQTSWTLAFLGLAALLDDRNDDAVRLLNDVLVRNRSIGDVLGMMAAVEFLGWASWASGDARRAAKLLGASQALAQPLGAHLAGFRGLRTWHDERVRQMTAKMGASAFEAALADGRRLTVDEAIAFALGDVTRPTGGEPAGNDLPLTRREREVARLVATGKTNKEIASVLVISQRTAEGHVEHILAKLGFTSRNQVVAMFAHELNG